MAQSRKWNRISYIPPISVKLETMQIYGAHNETWMDLSWIVTGSKRPAKKIIKELMKI